MRVVVAGWVLSVVVFVLLGVAVQQAVSQPEVLRVRRIEVVVYWFSVKWRIAPPI